MNDAPRIAPLIASILVLLIAGSSSAQPWSSHRPDGHAPIGVMGDHTHGAGEMMLSYRYMYMPMDGVLDGTDSIEPASVVAADGLGFMVTPTRMPMQMHMLGAMWAPTNELTLMGMLPFLKMEMDHLARAGTEFSTESAGIGDVRIVGLYTVARPDRQRLIVQFGASMPTGSIDEKDVTPASAPNDVRLPYPMQVGSGTFDLLPGVTYLGQTNEWSWGAQATATVRLGKNDNEYRFGNEGQVTAWGARRLSNAFGVSGRILGSVVSDVVDADPDLNPMMVPTAAAELQSGRRIDSGLGINAVVPSGQLHGLRVALELLVPLYQDVDGPQLGLDPYVIIGVQYAFDL